MRDETHHNMTKLDMLTPSQRVFAMFRARGKSVAESAKEAGVARNTPASTWDMELINAAILEIQRQMISSPMEAVGALVPVAIEQLGKAAGQGKEWAVREVFDRAWGKAAQTNKNEQIGEIVVRIIYADD